MLRNSRITLTSIASLIAIAAFFGVAGAIIFGSSFILMFVLHLEGALLISTIVLFVLYWVDDGEHGWLQFAARAALWLFAASLGILTASSGVASGNGVGFYVFLAGLGILVASLWRFRVLMHEEREAHEIAETLRRQAELHATA